MESYLRSCNDCKDRSCAVSALSSDELGILSGNCSEVILKKGEILLKAGSLTSHIIYLKSGLVKEFLTGINNRDQIVQIIKPHSYLGLSSLFGNKVNNYSYSALENLTVCYIDTKTFKNLIQNNGMFAYEILVTVCRENLNNYHRCINKSLKQMNGRLADALLYFSNIIYENDRFELPITQNDLAALTSTTRESINRTFNKFKTDGIITIDGGIITIVKKDLLLSISKNG